MGCSATIRSGLTLLAIAIWPGLACAAELRDAEGAIVDAANQFRIEEGVKPLDRDDRLTNAARSFAGSLAATTKFSHDADGRILPQRARAAGYDYCKVAENIGRVDHGEGLGEAEIAGLLMAGWKASAGHRENLLDDGVTQTGVGVAPAAEPGTYLAVQDFGLPGSARIRFKVINRGGRGATYEVGGRPQRIEPYQVLVHTVCPTEILTLGSRSVQPKAGAAYSIGVSGFLASEDDVPAGTEAVVWKQRVQTLLPGF